MPRDVTASGDSAIFFSLNKVTFFTSRKHFSLSLLKKKSNLVLSENLTSRLIFLNLIKEVIFLLFNASKTILLVKKVFIPTFSFFTSIISSVYFNFLSGLFDVENQTLFPFSS